jgi:hypothetical protein
MYAPTKMLSALFLSSIAVGPSRRGVHGPARSPASRTPGKRMELRDIRSARDRVLQYLRLRAGIDSRSVAMEGHLQDIAAESGFPARRCIGR